MTLLPGATIDTPFYRYRATGEEICEKCLHLDLVCFSAEDAVEIESGLVCSCPHVWDSYGSLNNSAITEHTKMGWSVGLSASGIPCTALCPADLLQLIEAERYAQSLFETEKERLERLFNEPHRADIDTNEVVYMHNVKLSEAEPYKDAQRIYTHAHKAVWNYVENLVRDANSLPHIGEGWISETRLFHIVESIFPNDEVIHHYRASWLDRLELDVYVVGADIGFEYQGIQHYKSQKHWGGRASLIRTQERDAEKARRCMEHGTRLIEVYYYEDLTEDLVRGKINSDHV